MSLNIATLGVEIDPKPAEAGAKRATAAAEKVEASLNKVGLTAKKTGEEMGKHLGGNAFSKMVSAAQNAARGVGNAFGSMVRSAMSTVKQITGAFGQIGLAIDGIRMVTAPVRGLIGGIFDNAAEMESFQIRWAYLLGGFDQAKQKMADLAKFANTTPFDLPGVTQAALLMNDLKESALKGMEGIRLVGDAAAKAGQPIEEIASRITRLQGNLKAGVGGGDELRALREWGIISADASMQIAELSTDPTKYAEAIKLVIGELQKAQGSMVLMSTTWSGLTSTFMDAIGALKTAFGTPLMEGLKPLLMDATQSVDWITSQVKNWGPAIKDFGLNLSAAFRVLKSEGGLQLSFQAATDYLWARLQQIFEALKIVGGAVFEWIAAAFKKQMAIVASAEFWSGVGEALVNAANGFLNIISSGIAEAMTGSRDAVLAENAAKVAKMSSDPAYARSQIKPGETYTGVNSGVNDALPDTPGPVENTLLPTIPSWGQAMEQAGFEATDKMKEYADQFDVAKEAIKVQSDQIAADNEKLVKGAFENNSKAEKASAAASAGAKSGKTGTAKVDELVKEAERFAEALRTPDEIMDQTMAKLLRMRDRQLLTEEQYQRAVKKTKEDYTNATIAAAEAEQAALERTLSGHQKLLRSWMDIRNQIDQVSIGISNSITTNMAGALTDLITGAKSAKEAFGAMASSIVNDITKMVTQMIVQIFYAKILGWVTGTPTGSIGSMASKMLGGGGMLGATVKHEGGPIEDGPRRFLPAAAFAGAPKFHGGGTVGQNEVPAILETGETVLTKDQAKGIKQRLSGGSASQPVQVTVINLQDPQAVAAYHAQNPDAIINILTPRMPQIRRMIQARA